MFSRKDYLEHKCSHSEYYAQFVNEDARRAVLSRIGKTRLMCSVNEHFNDIPLKMWDAVFSPTFPRSIGEIFRSVRDFPTDSGLVCIAKEAARNIVCDANASR